jgi:hypothetical protein
MKRWMLGAALFGALVVTAPSAWSQVNLLGLEQAPPEQVGVSKEKLGRIHDALQESIADGKLAGTVVLVARKGSSSMPTPRASRTRMKASRWRWIPFSASIR